MKTVPQHACNLVNRRTKSLGHGFLLSKRCLTIDDNEVDDRLKNIVFKNPLRQSHEPQTQQEQHSGRQQSGINISKQQKQGFGYNNRDNNFDEQQLKGSNQETNVVRQARHSHNLPNQQSFSNRGFQPGSGMGTRHRSSRFNKGALGSQSPHMAVDVNDVQRYIKSELIKDMLKDNGRQFPMLADDAEHYKKTGHFRFLIENNLSEEQDIADQLSFLHESFIKQYDPDDPWGLRLPDGHIGKDKPPSDKKNIDYFNKDANKSQLKYEKLKHFGNCFDKEKWEFNHFNKSFYLDSVPMYPDTMIHHNSIYLNKYNPDLSKKMSGHASDIYNLHANNRDTDNMTIDSSTNDETMNDSDNMQEYAPLYLPHMTQWLPTWTLKKKIAKTYGPHYINYITMPPMTLPDQNEFNAMLLQFMNEKMWKEYGVENIIQIEKNVNSKMAEKQLSRLIHRRGLFKQNDQIRDKSDFIEKIQNGETKTDQYRNEDVLTNMKEYGYRNARLGMGNPYLDRKYDIIPRDFELWDVDICYEMKHDGDPKMPRTFKDQVFRQFVTSIDRNGSMAPWQKNYAFSLLPRAFGGPEGDYLAEMFAKMAPKETNFEYELVQRGPLSSADRRAMQKREMQQKQKKLAKTDISGLGL